MVGKWEIQGGMLLAPARTYDGEERRRDAGTLGAGGPLLTPARTYDGEERRRDASALGDVPLLAPCRAHAAAGCAPLPGARSGLAPDCRVRAAAGRLPLPRARSGRARVARRFAG